MPDAVRAFYLDLSQWAIEDPARWARGSRPAPSARRRSATRKSNGTARPAWTPAPANVCPSCRSWSARSTGGAAAGALLDAARHAQPGNTFTGAGQTLTRSLLAQRPRPPGSGRTTRRRKAPRPRHEEEYAFWAWATVEVLRLTGIRIEELLELSHHSLVQYRLPTTGELVPLLQIAPSKTDAERLLVVSPELADVLSAIIRRVRDHSGAVPLVPAYDWHECVWLPPAPLLFQRRFRTENRAISHGTLRKMLHAALADTGLVDPADGSP